MSDDPHSTRMDYGEMTGCGCHVQFSREDVCPVAFGATVVRFEDCEVRRSGYRIVFCPLHEHAEQLAATLVRIATCLGETVVCSYCSGLNGGRFWCKRHHDGMDALAPEIVTLLTEIKR